MKKLVETLQKQTMDAIFNTKNSQLLTLSLPTEGIFQVQGQNRPAANLQVVYFCSEPREMPLPKPLNTQLLVFLSVFWFSSPSRNLNVTVCK